MALEWQEADQNDAIGNQVLIAHKNARLLKAHYDSYRYNYTPTEWFWNAGLKNSSNTSILSTYC